MKKFIRKILRLLGLELRRQPNLNHKEFLGTANTMEAALSRLLKLNLPLLIVDVGAAAGSWTELALQYWPSASFCLIEPLHKSGEQLHGIEAKHSK
jgi:hypothetical protein